MFSATWPKEVRKLAADFQTDAVFLNVGSMDLSANHNIKQNLEVLEEHQKPQRLFHLLEEIMNQVSREPIFDLASLHSTIHVDINLI